MNYLVRDILPTIAAAAQGAGMQLDCESDQTKLFELYNKITRRLLNEPSWQGGKADVCLQVEGCCITLDWRMRGIVAAKEAEYGVPGGLDIYSQGWKYLEGGHGAGVCGCGMPGWLEDMGDGFVLKRDLPCAMRVFAVSDRPERCAPEIEVFGLDAEGKEYRSKSADGWRLGVSLAIGEGRTDGEVGASPISSGSDEFHEGKFSQITALSKPKTVGYVAVYGWDDRSGEAYWLTTLAPNETRPSLRRYRVSAGHCSKGWLWARVNLRAVELVREDEVSLVQNVDAFELMTESLAAERSGDFGKSQALKNMAVSQLNKNYEREHEGERHAFNVRPSRALMRGRRYAMR